MLQEEGYKVHYLKVPQLGTGKETTVKVLTKPDITYSEVSRNRGQVRQITEHSDNHGRDWKDNAPTPPQSMSSKRIAIKYAEEAVARRKMV
jgi:hypothetical protein